MTPLSKKLLILLVLMLVVLVIMNFMGVGDAEAAALTFLK